MRRIGSEVPTMPGSEHALVELGPLAGRGLTVTVERPITKVAVPGSRRAAGTRAPPTNTPFFDPRSATATPCSSQLSRQCCELTVRS
jgi:hypothetical protein